MREQSNVPSLVMARRRLNTLGLALGASLFGSGVLASCTQRPPSFKSADITGADFGKRLTLTNASTGMQTSLEDFRGKLVVVLFGFLHCPDICPTTLLKAAQIKKQLGHNGKRMQVLFVTVDPERDTAEAIAKYVKAFDPTFIGLRGSTAEINKVAREFKIFSLKVPNREGTSYTVDHTTASYILDTDGNPRLLLKHTQPAEEIAEDIRQLL